jgi:hypothetical protein
MAVLACHSILQADSAIAASTTVSAVLSVVLSAVLATILSVGSAC